MGCDIHMYVEYRLTSRDDSVWRCGDYFKVDNPLSDKPTMKRVELYGDRNYALFAILADVRNYNLADYISEPKGLPGDATEYVKREYSNWGSDAHSCSYFTLQELIDYHSEYAPKDSFGYDILKPLINRLKLRSDELDVISDSIRIVFWFDN
jgi:hypothetical protein